MTLEEWRPVIGYEGLYEVSNHGRVRSLYWRCRDIKKLLTNPLIMSPNRMHSGHLVVGLFDRGRRRRGQIHRLVLEAFVGPCPDRMEGCHNDGDPKNNHLGNLRWDTRKGNAADMMRHGTYAGSPSKKGEENTRAVLTADDVRRIRATPNYRGINADFGREYGMRTESIANIRRGITWKHIT